MWATPPAFRCRLLFRSEGPVNEKAGSSSTRINPLIKARFCTRPPVNRGHTLNTILDRPRLGHEIERGDIPPYYPPDDPPITFLSVSTGPTYPAHHPLPGLPSSSSNYKYFASLITVERGKGEIVVALESFSLIGFDSIYNRFIVRIDSRIFTSFCIIVFYLFIFIFFNLLFLEARFCILFIPN